ncbi:MAG: YraN family protein [Clostridiales bacterium]|nr:YraN family protein [Clostridiales bacterium]MCD7828632.1 YraN family protein [Clostridiales bacterium]
MIGETNRTGMLGEYYAAAYLRHHNYDVLSSNYHTRTGEIDLVAVKGRVICFVEVKLRSATSYFPPSDAVDYRKRERIKSTAAAYTASTKLKFVARFDIMEIILYDDKYKVRYLKNAF